MMKRIIVPVDMGQLDAARHAMAVAKTNLDTNGRILLINVLEPLPPFVMAQLDKSVTAGASASATATLKQLAEESGMAERVDVRLDTGSIYRKILEAVGDPATEGIVMASHTPRMSDIVLGSVAAQIVRHARCSVYVVRFGG